MKTPFRPGIDVVSVSGATITPEDIDCVVNAVYKGWFTEGERHAEFSNEIKKLHGGRPITLCNSGSSALLIAMETCKEYFGFDQGYVITCATGFPTTVAPIIQCGFLPLFVDVDWTTINVDVDIVLDLLERNDVVGVVLAHTLGFPFDAEKVQDKAFSQGKFFIEDCSDALGAMVRGKRVGTFGTASTFSFFPAHHITTGEGGAVSWSNGRLAKIGNSFCSWGRDCWCKPGDSNTCNKRFEWEWENLPAGYDHKYTFTRLGYNLKMTELQAALGVSQLSRLDQIVSSRIANYIYLALELKFGEHLFHTYLDAEMDASPFGFPITVTSSAFTKRELVEFLETHKIATRPIFAGNITKQPMMEGVPFQVASDLQGSDYVMNNSFWIGCHDGLDIDQLNYVVDQFHYFFGSRGL